MNRYVTLARFLSIFLALALALSGMIAALPARANAEDWFSMSMDSNVNMKDLAVVKALEQSPSPIVIESSNLLYTPGFSTYTDVGKEIAKLHGQVAKAVVGKIEELDNQYQNVFKLNDEFNANFEAAFAAWEAYYTAHPDAGESVSTFYVVEKALQDHYLEVKELEAERRGEIASLEKSLAKMKKLEKVAANRSLSQSECLFLLLERFYSLSRTYLDKYGVVFSRALVLHTIEEETEMGLPAELLKQLQPIYEKERDLIAQILDADQELQFIEQQVRYGLDGLKVFQHEVLKISIAMMEEKMPVYLEMAGQMQSQPRKQEVATAVNQVLDSYQSIINQFKDIDSALDAEGRPEWLACNRADDTYDMLDNSSSTYVLVRPVYASPGILDGLKSIAGKTIGVVSKGAQMAVGVGKTVVNAAVSGAKKATAVVIKGAATAVRTVAKPVTYAIAGADVASQMVFDDICCRYQGVDKEGRRQIMNLRDEVYFAEITEGRGGAKACDQVLDGFTAAKEAAGEIFSLPVEAVIGEGYISNAVGYVGETVASIFTGMGEGIAAVANPDSSDGQVLAGVANIVVAIPSTNKLVNLFTNRSITVTAIKNEVINAGQKVVDWICSEDDKSAAMQDALVAGAIVGAGGAAVIADTVDKVAGVTDDVLTPGQLALQPLTTTTEETTAEQPTATDETTTEQQPTATEETVAEEQPTTPAEPGFPVGTYTWGWDSKGTFVEVVSVYAADGTMIETISVEGGGSTETHFAWVPERSYLEGYPSGRAGYDVPVRVGKHRGYYLFDGTRISRDGNGRILHQAYYKAGRQDGLETEYYKNGLLRFKNEYKDGKRHGMQEAWNEDGTISWQREWEDGKVVPGSWVHWSRDGRAFKYVGAHTIYLDDYAPPDINVSSLPSKTVQTGGVGGVGGGGGGGGH